MKVKLGFEDQYRIGFWTPLHIFLENQGPSVEGNLLVKLTKGNQWEPNSTETLYSMPVSLPSSSRKLYTLNVPLETNAYPLRVLLVKDQRTILKEEIPLRPLYGSQGLILVVNEAHSGFDFLTDLEKEKIRRVVYSDLEELPSKWIGYDGIQALILDEISLVNLTPEQGEAMETWLATGGNLVITGGGRYEKFSSSFLSKLLPAEILGKVRLNSSFSSLQDRYGDFQEISSQVEIWKSRWQKGEILLREKDIPLMVRLKKEGGQIFFLAFNPSQPPFRNWSGKLLLWKEILGEDLLLPILSRGILDSVIEPSFLSQRTSYTGRGWIFLYLLSYLLIIGFFYLLLIKGRFFLPWGIILCLVILFFTISSYLFFGKKIRRENTSLRQISIFYKRGEGSWAKTENYLALFSPYQNSFKLGFDQKTSFVTAISPRGGKRMGKDLTIFLDKGEIGWPSSSGQPWSFYALRLETVSPFFLLAETRKKEGKIEIIIENLNSFPLQDLKILYGDRQIFLEELPPSSRRDLTIDLENEQILPPSGGGKLRESSLEDLKKEIFQQIWEWEEPLKEVAAQNPLLWGWFEELPSTIVKVDRPVNQQFIGLVVMPLRL